MTNRNRTAIDVVIYTLLRVLLFVAVFVLIAWLTPIKGLWAAVAALLMSGAISVIVLDNQRNKVGEAFGRFFGRMNERIDASATAEDAALDAAERAQAADRPDAGGLASGEGEQSAEHKAVDQQ